MKNHKRTLISCAMLEDEVNHILEKHTLHFQSYGLTVAFTTDRKLNQLLQEHINQLQNQDEILLTFGLCGNGTAGLVSPNTMLRLPKFDDCINMLACRQPRTERKQTQKDALYLTRGWTLDHEGILQQYKMLSETYDEETRNLYPADSLQRLSYSYSP